MIFFIELNKIRLVGPKLTLSLKLSHLGQRKLSEGALSWRQTNYRGKEPSFVVAHLRAVSISLHPCCNGDIELLLSGKYCQYLLYADEEMKTQKVYVTCTRSHS